VISRIRIRIKVMRTHNTGSLSLLFEQVYYNFLLEFGFSKDILLVQPQFDSLDEHQDIYRDLTPILNMLACLNWLIK
jgi:hypothetical protein